MLRFVWKRSIALYPDSRQACTSQSTMWRRIEVFVLQRWHLSFWQFGGSFHALVLLGGMLFAASWLTSEKFCSFHNPPHPTHSSIAPPENERMSLKEWPFQKESAAISLPKHHFSGAKNVRFRHGFQSLLEDWHHAYQSRTVFEKVSFLGHKKMVKEDSVVFGGWSYFLVLLNQYEAWISWFIALLPSLRLAGTEKINGKTGQESPGDLFIWRTGLFHFVPKENLPFIICFWTLSACFCTSWLPIAPKNTVRQGWVGLATKYTVPGSQPPSTKNGGSFLLMINPYYTKMVVRKPTLLEMVVGLPGLLLHVV